MTDAVGRVADVAGRVDSAGGGERGGLLTVDGCVVVNGEDGGVEPFTELVSDMQEGG